MTHFILGMRVDATSYSDLIQKTKIWVEENQARSIYAANTHMVMEAYDDRAFRRIVDSADLVTPDGMPLVWWLRSRGVRGQPRVYGPDVMLHLCDFAAKSGVPVGLFGSTPEVLESLKIRLLEKFPGLKFGFTKCPPFGKVLGQDDWEVNKEIISSGIRILFVSLGCPKQEKWIAAHRKNLPVVMVAVGAAFPLHAGTFKQAPAWMQQAGLEWLYRLTREPGRLWRRYLITIPRFLLLVALEAIGIIHAR
jgi:N-acetylglucosaminyldiphosphoundecaprenol N-acetyl-beta-D-mannosaminyltransferase